MEAAKAEGKNAKKQEEEEKKDDGGNEASKDIKKTNDADSDSDDDDGFFDTISNANDEKRAEREAMRNKDKRTEIF